MMSNYKTLVQLGALSRRLRCGRVTGLDSVVLWFVSHKFVRHHVYLLITLSGTYLILYKLFSFEVPVMRQVVVVCLGHVIGLPRLVVGLEPLLLRQQPDQLGGHLLHLLLLRRIKPEALITIWGNLLRTGCLTAATMKNYAYGFFEQAESFK